MTAVHAYSCGKRWAIVVVAESDNDGRYVVVERGKHMRYW